MKTAKIFIQCIVALLLLVSCGEDRTHEYYELTKENQWIYNTMKDVYLWKNELKQPERSKFFSTPSKFFTSLLKSSDKASFITDTQSASSYGMTVSLMRDPIAEKPSQVYALVLFVEPGSPADIAGIERGTWISALNGTQLSISGESKFKQGDRARLTTEYIEFDNEQNSYFWVAGNEMEISASTPHVASSICIDSIYTVRNKKVGYILCNNFNGDDFIEKTNRVAERFLTENVTDIIVDLRYNTGGSISNTASFASMLVPAELTGTPFCTLKDYKEEIDTVYNYKEQAFNLGDKRIYFITGKATKGTAELLVASVDASRSMYDAFTIGEKSAGVNIVTEEKISPYGFTIAPATAIAYSSNGDILQSEGTPPDYLLNELENKNNIHQLGEEQEYLLYNAFYLIANGTTPVMQ